MIPMLASDYVKSKVRYPVILQPKVDGVRAVNLNGLVTGRSLKAHKNVHLTKFFSHPLCHGLDGEMAAERETHPALCRITASAMSTIDGEPYLLWWLFDYIVPATVQLDYNLRYNELVKHYHWICDANPELGAHLRLMPSTLVYNEQELDELHTKYSDLGYEGSVLRDPYGKYKQGRSTVREGGLLRIKDYVEEEAVVTGIEEGQSNTNEMVLNPLGKAERSTHQANMIPNGMVGALLCIDVKTKKDIRVAAGTMPHDDRALFFKHPSLIVGKTIKYKTFPKGVKDKPRHPTFQSIKIDSDI